MALRLATVLYVVIKLWLLLYFVFDVFIVFKQSSYTCVGDYGGKRFFCCIEPIDLSMFMEIVNVAVCRLWCATV
jgi:hypothetical protein